MENRLRPTVTDGYVIIAVDLTIGNHGKPAATDGYRWLRHHCCGLCSAVGGQVWLVRGLCDAGQVIQLSPWVQGVIWSVCDVPSCQISSRVISCDLACANCANCGPVQQRRGVEIRWVVFQGQQAVPHTTCCVSPITLMPHASPISSERSIGDAIPRELRIANSRFAQFARFRPGVGCA